MPKSPSHPHRLLPIFLAMGTPFARATEPDPYQWLEAVEDEEALDWVKARNEEADQALAKNEDFEALQARLLSIYSSDARIPHVRKIRGQYYNLWQDKANPRGLWRRTSLESYRSDTPEWETVLDLDALGKEEGINWVWGGSTCARTGPSRCMISLSRGGADATVRREFDLQSKTFVEDGFQLPESKGSVAYSGSDHLLVATDFGEGSLTTSGYPRMIKRWARGTPLQEAQTLFAGEPEDVFATAWHDDTKGFERSFVLRAITFYTNAQFQIRGDRLVEIPKPADATATVHREWLFLELRSDWTYQGTTYLGGSLLVVPYDKWLKGRGQPEVLFQPTDRSALVTFSPTRNHLLLTTMEDVRSKVEILTPSRKGWSRQPLPGLSELDTLTAWAEDPQEDDAYWLDVQGFLTPASLHRGEVGAGSPQPIKRLPPLFQSDQHQVTQHHATSADGTSIPYFQVSPKDLPLDGSTPTVLYGYGGFEVSLRPSYMASAGAAWLEPGGVWVVANIRGGGEFGPRWHQAALKENRHRAYEDFIAVGEDLVRRNVTSPEHLGIMGGSNGGLLVGNMYTLRPDLWGAVLCKVPLLDMRRYHTLLAGASWMGEYGNPDIPEEWSFIQTFSPYHNIDSQVDYPPLLLTTSTRDDRVHPGHARKMGAKLMDLKQPVLYWENIEGGHGGAADHSQRAYMDAIGYRFLWSQLK